MSVQRVAQSIAALFVLLSPLSSVEAAVLACDDLPDLFRAFHQNHYLVHRVTAEQKERTAKQFVKMLDPSRMYLLNKDVQYLEQNLPSVFEGQGKSRCGVLQWASTRLIEIAKRDESAVRKMLDANYRLNEKAKLLLDPEKRGFPETEADRLKILEGMVHFQISNYLLTKMTLEKAKAQLIHRYELITKRLEERHQENGLPEVFAEAFATSLDPHSSFMSEDTLEDFRIHMRLSLEGIGAALNSENGFTVIESLIPGGQAELSGKLRPKDKIIAVAQEGEEAVSVIDMSLRDVVKLIRGKKGTRVRLTILREAQNVETFDVEIVRDMIDVKEQAAKIRYETIKRPERSYSVGVIDLPSFYGGGRGEGRSSYEDLRQLLQEANEKRVDGLVLDMSRNGGGLLEDAVRISGLFLKTGNIVATKDSYERVEVLEDEDEDVVYSGPLVVVISSASASAAEILAGALKDYRRALIVGSERTFGKGTVQALVPMERQLGAIKVTTGMFFLPSGHSTQKFGVESDIVVPSVYAGYELGEKKLDYSLAPQSVPPFLSATANGKSADERWQPVNPSWLPKLRQNSAQRVKQQPEFAEIKKRVDELKKEEDWIELSALRKEAKQRSDEDSKKEFEAMELAFVNEGARILADMLALGRGSTAAIKTEPARLSEQAR